MATLLYTTSHGSDDPTRSTLAFVGALGAIDAGHRSELALLGEATFLMKDGIVEHVHGVGDGCGRARGVLDSDLEGKNARFITAAEYTEAALDADRMISI